MNAEDWPIGLLKTQAFAAQVSQVVRASLGTVPPNQSTLKLSPQQPYSQPPPHQTPALANPALSAATQVACVNQVAPAGAVPAKAPSSDARDAGAPADGPTPCCRDPWVIGSALEYCSASQARWYPALVVDASPDGETLGVRFMREDGMQQKAVRCDDWRLAPIGTHKSPTPPGFRAVASQSRPGQQAFLDSVTGCKYGSSELAWRMFLERQLQADAMPTICEPPPGAALGNPSSAKRFMWPSATGDSLPTEFVPTEPALKMCSPPAPPLEQSKDGSADLLPCTSELTLAQESAGREFQAECDDLQDQSTGTPDEAGLWALPRLGHASLASVPEERHPASPETPAAALAASRPLADAIADAGAPAAPTVFPDFAAAKLGAATTEPLAPTLLTAREDGAAHASRALSMSRVDAPSSRPSGLKKLTTSTADAHRAPATPPATALALACGTSPAATTSPAPACGTSPASAASPAPALGVSTPGASPSPPVPVSARPFHTMPAGLLKEQLTPARTPPAASPSPPVPVSATTVLSMPEVAGGGAPPPPMEGAQGWKRVAELEGALEVSRERVRSLDAELKGKEQELEELRFAAKTISEDTMLPDRIAVLETALKQKATELQDLRTSNPSGYTAEHAAALDKCNSKLQDLQRELQDQEKKLQRVCELHDKKEQDLQELSTRLSHARHEVRLKASEVEAAATGRQQHRSVTPISGRPRRTAASYEAPRSVTPTQAGAPRSVRRLSAPYETPRSGTPTQARAPRRSITPHRLEPVSTYPLAAVPGLLITPSGSLTASVGGGLASSDGCRTSRPMPTRPSGSLTATVGGLSSPEECRTARPMPRAKSPARPRLNASPPPSCRWRPAIVPAKPSPEQPAACWKTTYQTAYA